MLRERLADIEATPFDGCVFHVEYRVGKRRNNLAWRAWGREAIPAAAVEPALRDLRALRPRRLRHNSLRFNVTPGDVDWFDDFQPVLSNARLAARLAREGGAVGIVLDTEQYEGQLFDYVRQRDADSRSYDEYAAQVRKRGRELIAAFQSEHPSLALLMTFSYSLPWRDAQRTGKPLAELSYGMLAPFVDGLVDGTVGARLIDGYEMSYGYRSRREFDMAYARMSAGVLPLVADPARYRAVTTFAFWASGWTTTRAFTLGIRATSARTTSARSPSSEACAGLWRPRTSTSGSTLSSRVGGPTTAAAATCRQPTRRRSAAPGGERTRGFPRPLLHKIDQLAEGGWVDEAENVLAFGLPGGGKTHVACAIGHALIEQGYSVLFTPTFRLVQELLAAKRDLQLPRALRKLDRFDLVILDDIGYVQQAAEEIEVLFTLLSERYERRSLLITSNLVFSEWDRIFRNPLTTAAAIDRLVHHSVILEFNARSYRSDKAQERAKNESGTTA